MNIDDVVGQHCSVCTILLIKQSPQAVDGGGRFLGGVSAAADGSAELICDDCVAAAAAQPPPAEG